MHDSLFTSDALFRTGTQRTIVTHSVGSVSIRVNGPTDPASLIDLYITHKEECLHRLDAASSFVLYDASTNSLLAVRDLFGTYPLFYAETSDGPLFAASVKDLLASGRVPADVNSAVIASYLSWDASNNPIDNQTFFKQIYSLLPGYVLLWSDGKPTIRPYVRLQPDQYGGLSDAQYVSGFREKLVRSMQQYLPTSQRPAAHLSGGLDSSTICGIAQSMVLRSVHSYFIQTDTVDTQEEPFVEAVLDNWAQAGKPLTHQFVPPGNDPYEAAWLCTQVTGLPNRLLLPVNSFLPILEQAREAGCDLLLTGHGGDQIAGYGFEYMDELVTRKAWSHLRKTLHAYANLRTLHSLFGEESFGSSAAKRNAFVLNFFLRRIRQASSLHDRLTLTRAFITHFSDSLRDLPDYLSRKQDRRSQPTIPALSSWIRTDWQEAHGAVSPNTLTLDSRQFVPYPLPAGQQEQLDFMFYTLGIHYNEDTAALNAHFGLKTAHPFLDKSLLELTLNTPLPLRFAEGKGRGVLREAMTPYLPEKVRHRVDKGEFSIYVQQTFASLHDSFRRQVVDAHPIWEIVDKRTFERAIDLIFDEQYTSLQKNKLRFVACRVIYLALWLDSLKPVAG